MYKIFKSDFEPPGGRLDVVPTSFAFSSQTSNGLESKLYSVQGNEWQGVSIYTDDNDVGDLEDPADQLVAYDPEKEAVLSVLEEITGRDAPYEAEILSIGYNPVVEESEALDVNALYLRQLGFDNLLYVHALDEGQAKVVNDNEPEILDEELEEAA